MKSLFFRIKRFLEPRGGVGGVLRITRSYIRTNGLRRTVRRVMGIAVRSMFSGYLRTTVEAQVSAQFSSLVSGADSSLKILNRMPYDLRKLLHSSYRAPSVGRHPEYSAAIRLQRDAKSLIKAVAFYMPQPEPEVGPGFQRISGWSRVGRQAPQFVGHYQPHLPDDPSVCNAPSSASMSRQVELARQYGIHAFCFYHLLDASNGDELPVALETILADPAINIHIALCLTVRSSLSNEDPATDSKAPMLAWLQSSELMSLAHTLVTAMRDPRWVRVDGKPMLIILDDRRENALRGLAAPLRSAIAEAGGGAVHLIAAPLASTNDRAEFDAVLEYAPIDCPVQKTEDVVTLAPDFAGTTFDYTAAVAASVQTPQVSKPLYRSAMPNWDATGYGVAKPDVFANATPRLFASWLRNLCVDATTRLPSDRCYVFLNSWNGWESGSHLEPDSYFGHAYLEATRRTLEAFAPHRPAGWAVKGNEVAAIVHLYYPDLWSEIAGYLKNLPAGAGIYVSIGPGAPAGTEDEIRAAFPSAVVSRIENRGRDILPFLTMLQKVRSDGRVYLCKIHSKKSTHRVDGDVWRRDLYDKLLGSGEVVNSILYALDDRPSIGLIGPAGHMVPSGYYWGSNAANVARLGRKLGFNAEEMQYEFAAGTMFWAKVEALVPLLGLPLSRDDFDAEAGQLDGTLAHAVERTLPLSVASARMSTVDTSYVNPLGPDVESVEDYQVYAWAQRSDKND